MLTRKNLVDWFTILYVFCYTFTFTLQYIYLRGKWFHYILCYPNFYKIRPCTLWPNRNYTFPILLIFDANDWLISHYGLCVGLYPVYSSTNKFFYRFSRNNVKNTNIKKNLFIYYGRPTTSPLHKIDVYEICSVCKTTYVTCMPVASLLCVFAIWRQRW